MIEVKVDSQSVTNALRRLAAAAVNPAPALKAVGQAMVKSTQKRFELSTAPDGSKWLPNKPSTLKRKKGNKPLIGETGTLKQQISYAVSLDALRWGSNMKYAAMQQFGGKKSQFRQLWGDIPARPFVGVSDEDDKVIVGTIDEYLRHAVRG